MSYRDLNARANQFARYLRAMGVGPDTWVGVFLERSVEMVVALLAIHKAGGAYVPLDPAFPAQRLSFMAQNADLKVLVTETSLAHALPPSRGSILLIDDDWPQIARESDEDLLPNVTLDHLAYVITPRAQRGIRRERRSNIAGSLTSSCRCSANPE